MTARFAGSGPGTRTRDGCSVDLYRRLPYLGELDAFRASFGIGTTVLDLGCGTGRLAGQMAAWGAEVVAVDNSADMLAAVPAGIRTVLADIESLDLRDRFDVVLLSSCLVNHPDQTMRSGLARVARAHLAPRGHLLLQRQPVDWLHDMAIGKSGMVGPMEVSIEAIERTETGYFATLRYRLDDSTWRQSFDVVALSEKDIEDLVAVEGFVDFEWSGARRSWLKAGASS